MHAITQTIAGKMFSHFGEVAKDIFFLRVGEVRVSHQTFVGTCLHAFVVDAFYLIEFFTNFSNAPER